MPSFIGSNDFDRLLRLTEGPENNIRDIENVDACAHAPWGPGHDPLPSHFSLGLIRALLGVKAHATALIVSQGLTRLATGPLLER